MRPVVFAAVLVTGCFPAPALTVLTYNTAGNGAADWSTNSVQVQAIGRQMVFLKPDIITFQEIPKAMTYEMTHFVAAYLPGYWLATNSGSDGYIRSVIASRHPITRSQSWLAQSTLAPFGYNGVFTRDLFEAQIQLPGASEPLHVFTTHLKCCEDASSIARRAAEAGAISNFFVTGYLTTNRTHPYLLTGDLNEDIDRPPSPTGQPLQRLVNPTTGLMLTTPTNSLPGVERTFSIRASLTRRLDYVLPCGLLHSNMTGSLVFRSDLTPNPPTLFANDSVTASDHLPVLVGFNYPDPPLVVSLGLSNATLTLTWPALAGRRYAVEGASDLTHWTAISTNATGATTNATFAVDLVQPRQFYRVRRLP